MSMVDTRDLKAVERSTAWGWLTFVALIVLLTASKSILYDTLDPDCFWHLRVADQLLRDGIGPIRDHLAFTSNKTPWTPYSWLGELVMRGIWLFGGYRLAFAVQAMVIGGMYSLLAVGCRTRGASRLGVVIVLMCGAYLSLPYLSFRPATFALAMLAVAIWLLLRDRQIAERSRAVWFIVPLTAVMVNVHLFAFIVPVLVAGLFAGAIVERSDSRMRYGVMLVLCALACLATPMLPGLLRTMWFYQSGDKMVAGPGIAELTPFYVGSLGWISALLVVGGISACIWQRQMLRVADWMWLLLAMALLMRMGRFTPLFVLIAGPIVSRVLPAMEGTLLEKPLVRIVATLMLLFAVLRLVVGFPSNQTAMDSWLDRMGPDTPGYPCKAADFVAAHVERRTGRLLNEFTWGGYLEWRLGPDFQTFMDGRTQVFPTGFWNATCHGSASDLRRYLAETSADAAIVPLHSGRIRPAIAELGWREIYRDDRAAVYVPGPSTAVSGSDY